MAPTRPLVNQQIEACHKVVGIPQEHTAEITGKMNPAERKRVWEQKRVFFATPQTLTNDMKKGGCPMESIVCMVFDEAHRAQGDYAYCTVIRQIAAVTRYFRVLALSASPGSDVKHIQGVISNLLISHIEIRSEIDSDVSQYTHNTTVQTVVLNPSFQITQVRDLFMEILKKPLEKLFAHRVFYEKNPEKVTQFMLLMKREEFHKKGSSNGWDKRCNRNNRYKRRRKQVPHRRPVWNRDSSIQRHETLRISWTFFFQERNQRL